jgi:hypothetical protein
MVAKLKVYFNSEGGHCHGGQAQDVGGPAKVHVQGAVGCPLRGRHLREQKTGQSRQILQSNSKKSNMAFLQAIAAILNRVLAHVQVAAVIDQAVQSILVCSQGVAVRVAVGCVHKLG